MGVLKKILIGAGIAFLLIILVSAYFVWDFQREPVPAELREISGEVEVMKGGSARAASLGLKLGEGDSVKTVAGSATMVFFGGTLLRLDKDTKVEITQLERSTASVTISQSSGRTWNRVIRRGADPFAEKISKVKGIGSYEVELPTAVATVRGTSFSAEAALPNKISSVVGTVRIGAEDVDKDLFNQTAVISAQNISFIALELNDWINENRAKDKEFDKSLVERIRKKYGLIIDYFKNKYNQTDEQVDAKILAYLEQGGGAAPKI